MNVWVSGGVIGFRGSGSGSVYISISAVTATYGFALTATHFSKRRKVSKRLRPGVRRLAKAPRSLATVSIRGHRLRSASRRPPLDVCGFAARRYAPNPLMNTYARPAEGAKDQDQHQKPTATATATATASINSFASKLAPTGIGCLAGRDWSTVRPPSRASPLPQGDWCSPFAPHHSTGRALARLQLVILLLILICPPHREAEWRCSSGGQARSAVRRSRTHREEVEAKPTGGDAPRWMPERRNAEPRRGAGRSGRAFFCLLFFGV